MASSVSGDRPTLEDVAAYAGVSRSTASRALNEGSYVSRRSREAVLAAARDLGYSPNQAARSLVTKRTDAIALILSEPESNILTDPYFLTLMRAAFRALAAGGTQMLVMFVGTRDDIQRTTKFLEGGHVDGALVVAPHAADPLPTALRLLRVPVVFGGRPGNGKGLYTVDYDNVGGGRLAADHLIERGRRRIVTVCGPQDHPAARDRLLGWQKALAEHGIVPDGRAESGDFTQAGGEAAMTRLLARHPDLDAVFAASDPMAAGVLQALRAHGRRVPDDVAVVGFDDNPLLTPTLTPPLTAVHQDPGEQVRHMITILQDLLAGHTPSAKRQILPVSLTIRAST